MGYVKTTMTEYENIHTFTARSWVNDNEALYNACGEAAQKAANAHRDLRIARAFKFQRLTDAIRRAYITYARDMAARSGARRMLMDIVQAHIEDVDFEALATYCLDIYQVKWSASELRV